jgi:3-methyladenine DNA glycosylase Tag
MAKVVNSYADNSGKVHDTVEEAVIADLSNVLGRIGAEAGLTAGIAKTILAKRDEIEAIFAEFDELVGYIVDEAVQ